MLLDLNLYRVFFIVSKYKNISHASEVLYVSQPAVSKSIKTLENALGVKLFLRSSKGVTLTSEGEVLYNHIENGFEEFLLGERLIEKLKNKDMGNIVIGVSTAIGKNYLVPKLESFIKIYPNFKINIINRPTIDTVQLVQEDKIDLAIVGPPQNDDNLQFVKLSRIHDILVASPDYLKKLSYTSLEDLFNRGSFMLLENPNVTRNHIDNYFSNQNVNIIPDIEASNMDFLIECAKIGLGITSVIKEFILEDLKNKKLKEITLDTPIPQRHIGVIYKNASNLSIASKTLIDYLKNYTK
ncbi:LysR family transcriptional regulator [Clostridium chromiireducens]|uniref:HTH-type transcriptional regulator CynR n=1 Tax=Clostridium chromiireducens TaxID=225345 RepID=A0A1V4IDC5_9CLOT|nr:LysR family transcriptional regulator [Clostridium chromiireducens]OPJ58008.1 HTH-type transcriptional regulator CynR [Clostridium chromiireducens]RII34437.1 LysR family transcriptional regulator [Clostridium chromiireducens]